MARKYGKKASEKVARTMREFKRGKLRSGGGGKVTSREQAIAIGLSQARRRGYKVPPARHASMSLDARVRAYLGKMRPGSEIDARGMARAIGGVDPLEADYALARAEKAGLAATADGRWFGPATSSTRHHARKKSPGQLDREIAEVLGSKRKRSHARLAEGASSIYHVGGSKFGVEIDPAQFRHGDRLPAGARWRDDLKHLAEAELARGRTYRRPKDARYAVVEWTTYRGELGKLLDWLEATPGISRYAEIFDE